MTREKEKLQPEGEMGRWSLVSAVARRAQRLEDYLDDQAWWQNTWWPIWRLWRNCGPKATYKEARYFIQRGRRGYSDRDLWNADCHIARTVIAFIDKGGKWGIPAVFTKEGEPWEKAEERWKKVESEIRWLMEQHLEDDWEKYRDPAYRKRIDRANRLFGKYWMSLWD